MLIISFYIHWKQQNIAQENGILYNIFDNQLKT